MAVLNIFYQSHAGAWAITILLFLLAFILLKAGKPKAKKITQMILRLFFVIMVISGLGMLFMYSFQLIYVIKGILAIWLIAVMELILSKTDAKAPTVGYWVQFLIAAVLVILIGFGVIHF